MTMHVRLPHLVPATRCNLADRLQAPAYLDGGNAIQQGLEAGLVSDLTISIIPTLLGGGTKLFQKHSEPKNFDLLGSQNYPSGLCQLRYRPTP